MISSFILMNLIFSLELGVLIWNIIKCCCFSLLIAQWMQNNSGKGRWFGQSAFVFNFSHVLFFFRSLRCRMVNWVQHTISFDLDIYFRRYIHRRWIAYTIRRLMNTYLHSWQWMMITNYWISLNLSVILNNLHTIISLKTKQFKWKTFRLVCEFSKI